MSNLTSSQPAGAPVADEAPSRLRRRWLIVTVAVVTALAVATALAVFTLVDDEADLADVTPPGASAPAKLGVFRGTDLSEVQAFEQWQGKDVEYVIDFSTRETWEQIANPQLVLDTWRGTDYRVVHGLAMLPVADQAATLEAGARGEYDQYFTELGQRLVEGGQADAILRLGWEFNLSHSRWHTEDPRVFIQYWRSIVEAMRSVPGQQFQFDWNVNNGNNAVDAADFYPGDDVVDYVGVDVYDMSWANGTYPYPDDCDAECRQERQDTAWQDIYDGKRGLAFWTRFAASHGKPVTLPEWGLWDRPDGHGGGENPSFIRRMHEYITTNNVAYHAYFEFNADDGPHRLMETFPESAKEYQRLFTGN